MSEGVRCAYLVLGESIWSNSLKDFWNFFTRVIVDHTQKTRGDICVHFRNHQDIFIDVEHLSIGSGQCY